MKEVCSYFIRLQKFLIIQEPLFIFHLYSIFLYSWNINVSSKDFKFPKRVDDSFSISLHGKNLDVTGYDYRSDYRSLSPTTTTTSRVVGKETGQVVTVLTVPLWWLPDTPLSVYPLDPSVHFRSRVCQ